MCGEAIGKSVVVQRESWRVLHGLRQSSDAVEMEASIEGLCSDMILHELSVAIIWSSGSHLYVAFWVKGQIAATTTLLGTFSLEATWFLYQFSKRALIAWFKFDPSRKHFYTGHKGDYPLLILCSCFNTVTRTTSSHNWVQASGCPEGICYVREFSLESWWLYR